MKHKMHLHDVPYSLIKNGTKTVELRLYDDKRRAINIGDIIELENRKTKETMQVKVDNLYIYPNFVELYKHFDKVSIGYCKDEEASPFDMLDYYTEEEQAKYGVVEIKIKKI